MKMTEPMSFAADKEFLALQFFPYGFARSGDFTREQAQLLMTHGQAYQALFDGSREPKTKEEERFVAFCHGDREAESIHEKTWKRYQEKVQSKMRHIPSPDVRRVSDDSYVPEYYDE